MTTLNIPSSPSQGATYEANGVVYTWDGTKWKADSSYVSNLNGGPLAGFRNQIINGCLRNWQRGTAGNGTHYGADRMFFANPGTGGNNERDTNAPPESGLQYAYRINENAILVNSVEIAQNGAPFVNGSTWTFSFYARLDIRESSDSNIQFATGNAAASNSVELDSNFTWNKELLPSGWRRYSHTFTVGSNPAAGNNCIRLWFRNVASNSNTVTGFQLEPGPVATPFEQRPVGTEIALCQRYFLKYSLGLVSSQTGVVYKSVTSIARPYYVGYPVFMRIAPTVDVSDFEVRTMGGYGASTLTPITPDLARNGDRGVWLGSSNANTNYNGVMTFSGSFTADAEL